MNSPSTIKTLVGGMGRGGEVQCFWSEHDTGMLLLSPAWKECKAASETCTFLADAKGIYLAGHQARFAAAANDEFTSVAWYLLGQFAQGLAIGAGAQIGAHLVGAALTAPLAGPQGRAETPPREASYSPSPTTFCTPTGATIGSYPSYVCR